MEVNGIDLSISFYFLYKPIYHSLDYYRLANYSLKAYPIYSIILGQVRE